MRVSRLACLFAALGLFLLTTHRFCGIEVFRRCVGWTVLLAVVTVVFALSASED